MRDENAEVPIAFCLFLCRFLSRVGRHGRTYKLLCPSLPQAICFPLSNYKWTLHRSHIMLAVAWILSLLFRRVSRFSHDLQQIANHANWLAILSKFYEFCQINQFGEIEKLQKWFRIRQIIQQWNQLSSDSIPFKSQSYCSLQAYVTWFAVSNFFVPFAVLLFCYRCEHSSHFQGLLKAASSEEQWSLGS